MKRITTVTLAFLLASAACGTGTREADHPGDHEDAGIEAPHQEEQAPGSVRIEAEMLRDLRATTAVVERRPGGEGISVLGEIGVNENAYAEVGAPVPGRITRLPAAAGDRVRRGQPLGEIQSADVGRARAEHNTARAQADLARRTLERKRSLVAERIAAGREVHEAEAEAAAAEARLRAAAAALRAVGVPDEEADDAGDASALLLRAPIEGTILERSASVGEIADPARAVFRIADLSTLWLTVHAFERDAVRVRRGAAARVSFAALPGRSFEGNVALVGGVVDPESRTVPIRIVIGNHDGDLRPGMSATAWVALEEAGEEVVAVPAAALQRLRDAWCVFVPRGEGSFEIRPVGRGRDLAGEVEILSGLSPGEVVVVDGAFLLKAEAEKSSGEGEHHDH